MPLAGQQNPLLPLIQQCVDAITEHQRLNTLMKGELIKGLLPQSSVRAEYTVQRVRGRLSSILPSTVCFMSNNLLILKPMAGKNEYTRTHARTQYQVIYKFLFQ